MKTHADDQFDNWVDQWEKAQKDGIFKDAPKPASPRNQHTPDFFGQYPSPNENGADQIDAEYWRQVYQMSAGAGDSPDIINSDLDNDDQHQIHERFGEEGTTSKGTGERASPRPKKPSSIEEYIPPSSEIVNAKVEMQNKAKMMGSDPNPQYAASYGPDTVDPNTRTNRVSPGLAAADKGVLQLNDLKKSLYELECKMSDAQGLSESKVKSLDSKIKSIKQQIDEVSDSLVPRYSSGHF